MSLAGGRCVSSLQRLPGCQTGREGLSSKERVIGCQEGLRGSIGSFRYWRNSDGRPFRQMDWRQVMANNAMVSQRTLSSFPGLCRLHEGLVGAKKEVCVERARYLTEYMS